MFCPKCGDKLVRTGRELTCVKGKMGLSQNLEKRLTDCFILKIDKPKEFKFSFVVGGNWFCPDCGVKEIEKEGFICCPHCGLSLNEFIFQLVEIHPHAAIKEK